MRKTVEDRAQATAAKHVALAWDGQKFVPALTAMTLDGIILAALRLARTVVADRLVMVSGDLSQSERRYVRRQLAWAGFKVRIQRQKGQRNH